MGCARASADLSVVNRSRSSTLESAASHRRVRRGARVRIDAIGARNLSGLLALPLNHSHLRSHSRI
jgi:hypothetical protein